MQVELEDHSQVGSGPESSFSIDAKSAALVRDDSARRATVAIGSLAPRTSTKLGGDSTQPPISPTESEQPLAESIPTGPSETSTAVAAPKIDLGLNGGLLRMLDARAAATPGPKPGKPTRTRDSGAELIQVTVDAEGELSDLKLLRGEATEWTAALQSFRKQAKSKHVRVPAGAQGLRITFNVSAKVQRPSGKAVESGPIAVERPSFEPNGLTGRGTFDLADLSGKSARMISTRIVSEELL